MSVLVQKGYVTKMCGEGVSKWFFFTNKQINEENFLLDATCKNMALSVKNDEFFEFLFC